MTTAFLAGLGIVLCINLNTGFIADKKYKAILIQPVIAAFWCVGTSQVVQGVEQSIAYIVGSTVGCAIGMFYRRSK